jgi:hypothetical protein
MSANTIAEASAFTTGRLLNTIVLPIVDDEHDDGGDENRLEPGVFWRQEHFTELAVLESEGTHS